MKITNGKKKLGTKYDESKMAQFYFFLLIFFFFFMLISLIIIVDIFLSK